MDILLYITFICIIIGIFMFRKRYMQRKLPPGPSGLPFVGYLPFLRKNTHLQLFEISKKYGPIFSIQLGSQLYVILSNSKTIKEAFSKPELNGRPKMPFNQYGKHNNPFFENGEIWNHHRKHVAQCFRELGVGREPVQELILDQVGDLLSNLSDSASSPMSIRSLLGEFLSGVLSHISFGKKIDGKKYNILKEACENAVDVIHKTSVLLFFPWLNDIPFMKKIIRKIFEDFFSACDHVDAIINAEINEQKNTLDNLHPDSYLNTYLNEIKDLRKDCKDMFTEQTLTGSVMNIYGAGLSTTIHSLEWCLYNMAAKPDIQLKVHKEIDEVIGHDRFPTLSDQKNMPYTHSVLLEVQRCYSAILLNIPRMVLKDVNIMGYEIPKGTHIIANLYACHYDPESWEKPEEFRPERFRDPQSAHQVKKHDSFLPFSFGKRNCPGDILAQMEIFLCFVCILQNFDIKPKGQKPVDLEGIVNVVNEPKEQELCFFRRKIKHNVK